MSAIAQAYVEILPSARGISRGISKELGGVQSVITEKTRSGFLGGFTRVAGAVTAAVGAIGVGTIIGKTISSGLDRALNIDSARGKLEGLGYSAEQVTGVMDRALASVKGTAFGLDQAATVAAGALAAGVKPGQQLQDTLSLVADAATIAGTDMGSMGAIFNKVAASNKVQGDVLAQLADAGVPALQFLAKELGVTAEAAADMASRGEIDFATFSAAMQAGLGGAALASGDTARGAFANVGAAVARLGAMFVAPAVAGAPTLFQALAGAIDRLAEALRPVAEELGARLTPAMAAFAGWLDGLDFTGAASMLDGIGAAVGSFFSNVNTGGPGASAMFASIGDSLQRLGPAFAEFGAALPQVGSAVATIAAAGLGVLTNALVFLADNVDTIVAWMPALVAGFVAWRVASTLGAAASMRLRAVELAALPVYAANNVMRLTSAVLESRNAKAKALTVGATGAQTAALAANTTATGLNTAATSGGVLANLRAAAAGAAARVALVAGTVATGAATAAQWALNAAMSANPIALIVIAIAALVAGLIWFFTQTELGQQIWANFTQFLTEAWANVSAWFMQVGEAISAWWMSFWGQIVSVATAVWNAIVAVVTGYVNRVQAVVTAVVSVVQSIWSNAWNNVRTVISTVWSAIVSFVTSAINNVRDRISGAVNTIRGLWERGWNIIRNVVSTAFGNIQRGVQTGIGNVINFVRSLPDKARSALGNVGNVLLSAGRSLIQGFINGIKAMVGKVGSAVGGVLDFAKSFFPNSPAKRGPLSGSGWRQIGKAGAAIEKQFESGFTGRMDDVIGSRVSVPRVPMSAEVAAYADSQSVATITDAAMDRLAVRVAAALIEVRKLDGRGAVAAVQRGAI